MPGLAPSLSPATLGDSFSVSGGSGYSATSSLPPTGGEASGLGSALDTSGPWWIEEQRADISYFRAPRYAYRNTQLYEYNFSLSGSQPGSNNIVSGSIQSTDLMFKANITTAGYWSDDMFSTSSNVVLQKFTVNPASSDANGNTYGTLSAGCFGPVGEVITSQAYHSRTPYAGQTNYTSSMTGYNFFPYNQYTYDAQNTSGYPTEAHQEDAYGTIMYFFNRNLEPGQPWPRETYLRTGAEHCAIRTYWHAPGQSQNGSYDSTLEVSDFVSHWINQVCEKMKSGTYLYNRDYAITSLYADTYQFARHRIGELYYRGMAASNYQTNRHDFS